MPLGGGGDISIEADRVLVDGGGIIAPSAEDFVNRGAIGLSVISAGTQAPGSGPAGNIEITAGEFVVRGGGLVDSSTQSVHPGGNVTVIADKVAIETNARIDTATFGLGDGGTVTIEAADLVLADGGIITASSTSPGLAGDLFISVTRDFKGAGGIVTTAAVESGGGNITINAGHMFDLLNSDITTSVQGGAGAGGNITIDPQFVIVQNSNIIANAFGGPGGNINIVAGLFVIDPASVISASSALGLDGIINVDSPVSDVTSGVTELPANVLDASTLVQAPCAARTAGTSSLTSAGRSGLPVGPDDYLPSPGFGLATNASATLDAANIPVSVRDAIDGGPALQLAMAGLECS